MFLFSCNKNIDHKQQFDNKEGFKTITINSKYEEKILSEKEYLSHIEFVPLDTDNDYLIGEVDKMAMDNNFIYILDKYISNSLFVFKRNGEFVQKIGTKGGGPGEYISIWDFELLPNSKLMILDFTNNKLLFYENFNYTHTKNLIYPIESIAMLDSYYYFRMKKYENRSGFGLLISNKNIQTIKKEFEFPPKSKEALHIPYNFREYSDSLTLIQPFENKIYRIKENNIIPKYYFDFGAKRLTYEVANFTNINSWSNHTFLNGDFYENDNFIVFKFVNDGFLNTGLYNKKTSRLRYSKYLSAYIQLLNNKYIYNDNEAIFGVTEAQNIAYLDQEIKKQYGLMDVMETDNPIITISHFIKE
jgi:hypothetical protein